METVRIPVGEGTVSGRLLMAGPIGLLLAHGAGTNQDHPRLSGLRDGLATRGLTILTFNYPYTEAGRKRPDVHRVLVNAHRAARDFLMARTGQPVVLAGRSMGGRIGTHLAAGGDPCLGLVCYAYPLHPAGRPDKLRVEHLPQIKAPMLFFQGTRDPLSRMDLFDRYVRPLPNVTVEWLEGEGHSLGGARTEGHLAEATVTWVGSLQE